MLTLRTGVALAMLLSGTAVVATPELSAQKKQRDFISREELEGSGQRDQDAFAAIRSLRPHFVAPPRGSRTLGGSTMAQLVVYLDAMKADLRALRTMPAADIVEVRYLEPSKAEEQYGITHSGGAILVKTRKAQN